MSERFNGVVQFLDDTIAHEANDFVDEEILVSEMSAEQAFMARPTNGSVIVCRNGMWMQVRTIHGEQRIEI